MAAGPAVPLAQSQALEGVGALAFDPWEEALWLGGGRSGGLEVLFCPDLSRLAAFPGHLDPVARLQDAGALPGAAPEGGAMLSLSSRGLRVHRPGGAPVVEWGDPGGGSGEQWASCCLLGGGKVAVGGRGGGCPSWIWGAPGAVARR